MTPTRLLALIFCLALIWGGYWAVSAWTTQRALVAWMEDRRDDGWQAEWSDITVRGFPNRLDRTIHDLELADPESGWAWIAPQFHILGLTYVRDQLILVWSPDQQIFTPHEKMTLTGSEMRASLVLSDTEDDVLDHATLIFRDLDLSSDTGWRWTSDALRIGLRRTAGRAGWVDLGVEAEGLTPPRKALGALGRSDLTPDWMQRFSADIAMELDRPIDRIALETDRPQPRDLEIREIRAIWGELDLAVAGDLTINDRGQPRGELQIKARNWRDMLDLAEESGALPKAIAKTTEAAIEGLSRLAGTPDTLDVLLNFRSGRIWLGPIPLGQAPRIMLP